MRRSNRIHRRLFVEELEPRVMLAGDVMAGLVGGNLVIIGDGDANDIVIDQTGLDPDEFRIASGSTSPTTINSGAGPVVIEGITGHVAINMGNGDDILRIRDGTIPKNLTVAFGTGTSLLDVDKLTVKGGIRVDGEGGNNTLEIHDIDVTRDVRLGFEGGSNNMVTMSVATLAKNTIGKELRVTGTTGVERVNLFHVTAGGNVKLELGWAYSRVVINDLQTSKNLDVRTTDLADLDLDSVSVEGKVTFRFDSDNQHIVNMQDCTLSKNLDVFGGGSVDNVQLSNVRITGKAKFELEGCSGATSSNVVLFDGAANTVGSIDASGDNLSVWIENTTVTSGIKVTAGANDRVVDNNVRLEKCTVGKNLDVTGADDVEDVSLTDVDITGKASLNLKGEANKVTIGGAASTIGSVDVKGDILDDVQITNTTVASKMKVKAGDGDNDLLVENCAVGKGLDVTGGDQSDEITLTDVDITGKAGFKLDGGGNTVTIGGTLSMLGSIDVQTGDIGDTISIANTDVASGIKVKAGDGVNNVTIDNCTTAADVSIQTGVNTDTVNVKGGSAIGRNARIKVGDGTNTVTLSKDNTIGRDLSIYGGEDEDTITVNSVSVTRHAKFNLDDGVVNKLTIDPSSIGGKLDVFAFRGDNTVTITDTDVDGPAVLQLGHGNNVVTINVSSKPSCNFGSDLFINVGDGGDTIDMSLVEVTGEVYIKGGHGENEIQVADCVFHADFGIKTGRGWDRIDIDSVAVADVTVIRTGCGIDFLYIDDSTFGDTIIKTEYLGDGVFIETDDKTGARTTFDGMFGLDGGTQDDSFIIGVNGSPNDSADFKGDCTIIGSRGTADFLDMGIDAGHLNGNTVAGALSTIAIENMT